MFYKNYLSSTAKLLLYWTVDTGVLRIEDVVRNGIGSAIAAVQWVAARNRTMHARDES